jgi:hypothetical protein
LRQRKSGLIGQLTSYLLQEVQFIWSFLWQNKKWWPLNTGDCLIEVTTWTGLTVLSFSLYKYKATTIFLTGGGTGIFIVLVKKISEPSSVKIFFSQEKESKKKFSYHVEQKYIFPIKHVNINKNHKVCTFFHFIY